MTNARATGTQTTATPSQHVIGSALRQNRLPSARRANGRMLAPQPGWAWIFVVLDFDFVAPGSEKKFLQFRMGRAPSALRVPAGGGGGSLAADGLLDRVKVREVR